MSAPAYGIRGFKSSVLCPLPPVVRTGGERSQKFKKKDPLGDCNRMLLQWNIVLQPGMKATAISTSLGMSVKSFLPNSYRQRMNIQENVIKRRA